MEAKVKLFGHPVHQMLVPIPFGLLVMGSLFDIALMVTGNTSLGVVSYWNIAAGVVTGLVAAVFGLLDWRKIPGGTRAKRIGLLHAAGNVAVIALFSLAWLLRRDEPGHAPTTVAFVLELIAFALGGVTGWLGGELVDRLGVGVDDGAHVNAPSSISGRPARL